MKKIVILTGAGISAESGISTFRDSNGLWENHKIEEVATPEAFESNPELVLDFYNKRRAQLFEVQPNIAHQAIASLEDDYYTVVITQNVDDLHQRAGSTNIIPLHGNLKVGKSSKVDGHYQEVLGEIKIGDLAQDGSQLRPHIVWFGEEVPLLERAIFEVKSADYVLIIGTSMQVYPAANLFAYAPDHAKIYYIDPNASQNNPSKRIITIEEKATIGVPYIINKLKEEHGS
jgi:NAD-dependent deacetylase